MKTTQKLIDKYTAIIFSIYESLDELKASVSEDEYNLELESTENEIRLYTHIINDLKSTLPSTEQVARQAPESTTMFSEKDLENAIEQGIFDKQNNVTVPPATVIRYFEKWADLKCKLTARNVRHKAAEMVNDGSERGDMLGREMMNIQYDDVKPY